MPASKAATRGKRKRRRPLWKRLLLWLWRLGFLFVTLTIVLALLLPSITDSSWFKNLVSRGARYELNGAVVRLRTLRVSPLDTRCLVIEGFSLAPPGEPDAPIVSVERLVCRWSPLHLLDGELILTDTHASGVSIRLAQREDGWNFTPLLPPDPTALPDLTTLRIPLPVQVGSVSVTDITFDLTLASGQRARIGPASVAFQGEFDTAVLGRAQASSGDVSVRLSTDRPVEAALETGARLHVVLERDSPEAARLRGQLSLSGGSVSLLGTAVPAPLTVEAELDATLDLARLAVPEATVRVQVPGAIEDTLRLALTRPSDWRLDAENLLTVDLEALGEGLSGIIESLQGASEGGPLSLLRSLAFGGSLEIESHVQGSFSPGVSPSATFSAENRVRGEELSLSAGAVLPARDGEGIELSAELKGLDVHWLYSLTATLADRLAVRSTDDFALSAESARLSAAGLAEVALEKVEVTGKAADELPRPFNVSLSAGAQAGALTLKAPQIGQVAFPVRLAVELTGADLADPGAATLALKDLSGSLGPAVPAFRLTGALKGYGGESIQLNADVEVGPRDVLALADGLDPTFRDLLAGLDVGGSADAWFRVDGALPRAEGTERLELAIGGTAALPEVTFSRGDVAAAAREIAARFEAVATVGAGYRPVSLRCSAGAEVGPVEAAAGGLAAGSEGAAASGSVELSGKGLRRLSGEFEADVLGLGALLPPAEELGDPVPLGPVSISASASARADLPGGDLTLEDITLAVPSVVTVTDALLEVEGFGATRLNAQATVELPDIAAIAALVPEPWAWRLPEVSGSAVLTGGVDGSLPLAGRLVSALREGVSVGRLRDDLLASLGTGEPWPELRLLPIRRFWRQNVLLSGSGEFALRDFALSHRTPGGIRAGVEGVSADARLQLSEGDVEAEVALAVPAVHVSLLPAPLEDLWIRGKLALSELDRLRLVDGRLSALKGVFTAGMDGEIAGLSAIATAPTLATLLTDLNVSARGQCRLKPEAIGYLEGWDGSGGAGVDMSLELAGGETLTLDTLSWLDGLSVECAGLFGVAGVSATVPFTKTWRIVSAGAGEAGPLLTDSVLTDSDGAAQAPDPAAAWERSGLALAFDRLVRPTESLRVGSVSLLGRKVVEDVGIDLDVTPSALLVPRASLKVLGGRMVGRAGAWRAADELEVRLESEFDGLDARAMLPPHLRDFKGDSSISGSARGEVVLRMPPAGDESSAPALLKEVAGRVDVTHIGASALDRALLVLDPQAEDPGIVQMRGQLGLASPRSGRLELKGAFVGIDVELQGLAGRLMRRYSIPPFSIAEALRSRSVESRLAVASRMLSLLRLPMEALGAEEIVLKADGSGVELR